MRKICSERETFHNPALSVAAIGLKYAPRKGVQNSFSQCPSNRETRSAFLDMWLVNIVRQLPPYLLGIAVITRTTTMSLGVIIRSYGFKHINCSKKVWNTTF